MRSLTTSAFALAVLVSWAVQIGAADKEKNKEAKMVPEEGAVEIMLLRQPSVRKELKLSNDESTKIDEYAAKQWQRAQDASGYDEKKRDQEFVEMTKENDRFLDETLKKEQRHRLDQIAMQVAGLLNVTRPAIASKLGLTDEQKKQARVYQKEARESVEELLYTSNEQQRKEQAKELRQTSRKRLMELLTAEQETKWKEMTGAPFTGEIEFEGPDKR